MKNFEKHFWNPQ